MGTSLALPRKFQILEQIERGLQQDPRLTSDNTREAYLHDLVDFEDWRKNAPMTKSLVEEYATALRAEGKSPATINRALAAIRWWARKVADMAYEDVSLSKNVREEMAAQAARVAIVRDVKGERIAPGRYIPQRERAQLDRACFERNKNGSRTSAGVRDVAILCTAWATGLRVSELAHLDLEDVERNGQWNVIVRDGKGRKDRAVPVNTELKRRLREWLSVRGHAPGPLFVAIAKGDNLQHGHGLSDVALSKMLAKRVAQAGIKALTWHDFRRTFASDLLDQGVDIVTVQKLMGHSSPATTSGYDRRGDRARREAVEKLMRAG